MLIEGDSPVVQKLNGIHEAGTAALRAGSVEPFTGYPETLKNRFGVYFRYTEKSERLLRDRRILNEVEEIAQDLGIGLFLAGRPNPGGYPLHTTVLEGLYEGGSDPRPFVFGEDSMMESGGLRDNVFHRGSALDRTKLGDLYYAILAPEKRDYQLKFNAVLVDKGPVLLAATEIPQEIIDIRGELAEIYTQAGCKPLPLDNLLHMTLTRMTRVVDPLQADEYIRQMRLLHQEVVEDPLFLSVRTIDRKNAFDMLTSAL